MKLLALLGFGLMAQAPPPTEQSLPPSFFIQDQNRWHCILKGEGINEGQLPRSIECTHSKSGKKVVYLPVDPKKEEKK